MSHAQAITRAHGGDWSGNQGSIPTPGHSSKDRGLSVRDNEAGDDVIVYCHQDPDFDWRPLKDEWRGRGLLPSRSREPAAATPPRRYVYRDADGSPTFCMVRGPDKRFYVEHLNEQGGWTKGMNGTSPLPYMLPELLAADPGRLVFICEGEKDADNVAALGLIATTNPNGAGKWRPDFAKHLTGRECVILPDNDEAGVKHAEDVRSKLTAAGVDAIILDLPDLPEKGDVSDWIARGGTAGQLERWAVELFDSTTQPSAKDSSLADAESSPPMLTLIDPGSWQGVEPPARRWAWNDFIPARQMTLLGGSGGSGKSLLAQMLSTCMSCGLPCLGVSVHETISIYVTCEDDGEELHRRQAAICDVLGVPLHSLSGRLHLVTLAGGVGNELVLFDAQGRMSTTPAWNRLRATILATKAGFLVLDNVAHLFAGNEIIRHHVAAFTGLLNGLAAEARIAILLIVHPAKEKGSEYSGSTAWENQVRSRLFLEVPRDATGAVTDPDTRTLTTSKSNYARKGDALTFRWHRWSFVLDKDLPEDERHSLAAALKSSSEDAAFLSCLEKATGEKRAVSAATSASNYAPRVFAAMPTGKGTSVAGFAGAMQRLLHSGVIENGVPVYKRDNRAVVSGLGLAPTPAPTMHKPAH